MNSTASLMPCMPVSSGQNVDFCRRDPDVGRLYREVSRPTSDLTKEPILVRSIIPLTLVVQHPRPLPATPAATASLCTSLVGTTFTHGSCSVASQTITITLAAAVPPISLEVS